MTWRFTLVFSFLVSLLAFSSSVEAQTLTVLIQNRTVEDVKVEVTYPGTTLTPQVFTLSSGATTTVWLRGWGGLNDEPFVFPAVTGYVWREVKPGDWAWLNIEPEFVDGAFLSILNPQFLQPLLKDFVTFGLTGTVTQIWQDTSWTLQNSLAHRGAGTLAPDVVINSASLMASHPAVPALAGFYSNFGHRVARDEFVSWQDRFRAFEVDDFKPDGDPWLGAGLPAFRFGDGDKKIPFDLFARLEWQRDNWPWWSALRNIFTAFFCVLFFWAAWADNLMEVE